MAQQNETEFPEWFSLLQSRLNLSYLVPPTGAVPFGMPGVPADRWHAGEIRRRSEDTWVMLAGTSDGLEATCYFSFFPDTSVVEIWGDVANRGTMIVPGITRALTLDTVLNFDGSFGKPRLRTVNGSQLYASTFPPFDFRVVDRQLMDTPQTIAPIVIAPAEDGRSSADALPTIIIGSEGDRMGIAMMLEWSAMWSIVLQQDPVVSAAVTARSIALQAGIWGLSLDLKPGQRLPLPRMVLASYAGDLEAGGNALRRHIRRHVMPTLGGAETLPPLSYNHWFAFRNDFTEELLREAVPSAAAAGLEYFCVDSGWFDTGTDSLGFADWRKSLGNWNRVDPRKFPSGIEPFADYVRANGMQYGTWFEPEWAHKTSDMYLEHPDWFLDAPELGPDPHLDFPNLAPALRQVNPDVSLMNFGLKEVRAWWVSRIVRAYDEWGMRWVRWDFNQKPRPNWDHGVPSGEIGWRQIEHVEGLYSVLEDIIAACPDLLIEQCASGGHRIDLGMVRRGHTFWMNDHTSNSDIVRAFQHGLNTVLPGNFANTNLCQPRHDFDEYDYLSHGAGGYGYSGRLWEAPAAEFERYRASVARFKEYRHVLLGDYHRPTGQPTRADEHSAVEFVDKGSAVRIDLNQHGPRSARIEFDREPSRSSER